MRSCYRNVIKVCKSYRREILSLLKNIRLYERLVCRLHIVCKIETVLRQNKEFCGLEKVLPSGIDFDNIIYDPFRQFPK